MEYRNKQLNFRVTEAEYQAIKRRMEIAGVTHPSAFLRKMAMDGYLIKLDLSDLKEIARLSRINSNNLNQYAMRANENGNIYASDIKDLLDVHFSAASGRCSVFERPLFVKNGRPFLILLRQLIYRFCLS